MSATGRGTVRDKKDFYATPRKAFEPLLEFLPRDVCFWEPCAGDGRLIRWLRESGRAAAGADLNPRSGAVELYPTAAKDFLLDEMPYEFVLTNPPFSVAFEMCRHAKKHAREFMFLLRLSFLESEERGDWLAANEPAALFVLRKRPSFVMSCTCKRVITPDDPAYNGCNAICRHNWLLPIEAPRPTRCPACKGNATWISVSTSDNCGYAWFYWGHRFKGIFHI